MTTPSYTTPWDTILGMASVNAGVLFFEGGRMGTLFLDPERCGSSCLVHL